MRWKFPFCRNFCELHDFYCSEIGIEIVGEHGHQVVGICVGVMVAALLHHWGFPLIDEIAGGVAAFPGATAPDWLEIAHAKEGLDGRWHRSSIIPHRTITHWLRILLIMGGDSADRGHPQSANFLVT